MSVMKAGGVLVDLRFVVAGLGSNADNKGTGTKPGPLHFTLLSARFVIYRLPAPRSQVCTYFTYSYM